MLAVLRRLRLPTWCRQKRSFRLAPLQHRLTIVVAAVLLGTLALTGITTYVVFSTYLMERLDDTLRDGSIGPNGLPNGPQDGLSDALMTWCRRQLAGYKCPRSFEFVAVLPLSAAGKVLKTELRARAQRAAA